MKKSIVTLLVLLPTFTCFGQTMTPNYNMYTTLDVDEQHGTVTQTVVVDGYTNGSCTVTTTVVCGPNGQTCTYQTTNQNCANAKHTSVIKNVVGSSGGTTSGPAVNPFSYSSFSTTTQAPLAVEAAPPTTEAESYIDCSWIGPFWPPSDPCLPDGSSVGSMSKRPSIFDAFLHRVFGGRANPGGKSSESLNACQRHSSSTLSAAVATPVGVGTSK